MGQTVPTTRYLTVVIACHKVLREVVRNRLSLSINELVALLLLSQSESALTVDILADYMMLKTRSVLSVLAGLEDRDLIRKADAREDGRKMLISPTPYGRKTSDIASDLLGEIIEHRFPSHLPQDEFVTSMLPHAKSSLNILRGHSMSCEFADISESRYDEICSFLLFPELLVKRCASIAASSGGMTLDGYRILAYLAGEKGVSPKAISSELMLPKSRVSACGETFLPCGYITRNMNLSDGRSVIWRITRKGMSQERKADKEIDELVRIIHLPLREQDRLVSDAWYTRIYLNLRN